LGFQELSPHQTVNELFGHLQAGDHKVAITTRYYNNNRTKEYVQAFQERNITARVVTGQKGIEDFCFLTKAQKELAGNAVSSFAKWAAFLGNATTARLYVLDQPDLRKSMPKNNLLEIFGWLD
jgi:hypothetical protein